MGVSADGLSAPAPLEDKHDLAMFDSGEATLDDGYVGVRANQAAGAQGPS